MAFGLAGVVLLGVLGLVVALVAIAVALWRALARQARRAGYATTGEYLRAAPRSDEEKRNAVDMALEGLVLCLLGFLFPPLLLVGLFPLFYGGRKLAYASLGLGLIDDADQPGA